MDLRLAFSSPGRTSRRACGAHCTERQTRRRGAASTSIATDLPIQLLLARQLLYSGLIIHTGLLRGRCDDNMDSPISNRQCQLLVTTRRLTTEKPVPIFDASPYYLWVRWGRCFCHHGISIVSPQSVVKKILCLSVAEFEDGEVTREVRLSELPTCCIEARTPWVAAIAWKELDFVLRVFFQSVPCGEVHEAFAGHVGRPSSKAQNDLRIAIEVAESRLREEKAQESRRRKDAIDFLERIRDRRAAPSEDVFAECRRWIKSSPTAAARQRSVPLILPEVCAGGNGVQSRTRSGMPPEALTGRPALTNRG